MNILARGEHAKTILDDELFQGAVKEVKDTYTQAIIASDAKDTEARERAFFCIRALEQVVARLEQYQMDGELKRKEIERNDLKKAKRAKIKPFLQ